MTYPMQSTLESISLKLKDKFSHQVSVNKLHGEDGFYIDLDLINYQFNGKDEFVLFELLISNDGRCRSVSAQYCEVEVVSQHNCWDTIRIPPPSFDMMVMLKHIENSSKEEKSIKVDLIAARKIEAKVKEIIQFFETELRKNQAH